MIKVMFDKEDGQFPIRVYHGDVVRYYTKKAACELNRELAKVIHKMIEAE